MREKKSFTSIRIPLGLNARMKTLPLSSIRRYGKSLVVVIGRLELEPRIFFAAAGS